MASKLRAFTLIELLVVVTIIVILIAILTPSLEKAIKVSEDTKCTSNLKGVGLAHGQYLNDYKASYPTMITWNMLFGNKGDNGYGEQGYDTSKHWLLNPYLGVTTNNAVVKIAECPSDKGDHAQGRASSYAGYGTSYLCASFFDAYRVKMVYGAASSLKSTQISRTDNKMLVADWIWHANRSLANPQTQWHSNDKRLLNTLFADFHVTLLDWVNEEVEFPPYRDYPPNPSHIFW